MKSQTLILIMALLLIGCNKQSAFNSKIWKSSGGELIMTDNRLNMTDDLLSNNLLMDKTKAEIDSLLGFSIASMIRTIKHTFIL